MVLSKVLAVAFLMEIDDKLMELACNMGWKVRPADARTHRLTDRRMHPRHLVLKL